jgi:hypothetical protein
LKYEKTFQIIIIIHKPGKLQTAVHRARQAAQIAYKGEEPRVYAILARITIRLEFSYIIVAVEMMNEKQNQHHSKEIYRYTNGGIR